MDRNVQKRTESKCQTYGVKKKKFQNGPKSFLSRTKLRGSVGNAKQSIFYFRPCPRSAVEQQGFEFDPMPKLAMKVWDLPARILTGLLTEL